ncbi:MAG: serine/threonine protein kinase [Myxococcales bacterium]|nr:serine/threonine protein kinase [Myxococcales bacterium]
MSHTATTSARSISARSCPRRSPRWHARAIGAATSRARIRRAGTRGRGVIHLMAMADADPRIGSVLEGRYRIIERIARGGMGVVYRAERIPVGRPVAVKFLHAMFADDPDSRARFERETRALARLAHSHCVSIIDFGVAGSPYLVMEHVAGVTLRDLLDEGALPLEEALTLGRQLLAGLAHAHAQGIVHRDVKPANIMVTDEIGTGRHVRILDFGLARLRDTTSSQLTQAQIAVGTPSYMAPEQTLGGAIDARTDVYAAGVVLFEMLTGERPFSADDTATLLELHRSAPAPRLATVDPITAWPPGLDLALARALAKAPGDRWPSAVEFADALDVIARGVRASTAPPPGLDPAARRPRRTRTALLALALAGGAAAFAVVELRPRSHPSAAPATTATIATRAGSAADPQPSGSPPRPAPRPPI